MTMTIEDTTAAGEPVVERITQNIVDALEELTKAAGIYANAKVYRPSPAKPPPLRDYRLVVIQSDPELDEENDGLCGVQAWVQPYQIVCEAVLPENAVTPIDRVLNRIRADVEKKLREDPQRGGLAWDTRIMPPVMDDTAETARAGTIEVRVNVHYRTIEDDPYLTPTEFAALQAAE